MSAGEPAAARRPGRAAGAAAAVLATGALACGVCCALPFALPAVVLAVSGGVLAWLGSAYSMALIVAAVAVVAAWLWVSVHSLRTRRWPARATLAWMVLASLVLAAAIGWPWVEQGVILTLRADGLGQTVGRH